MKINFSFAVLLAIFSLLLFSQCSKEDDCDCNEDNNNTNQETSAIIDDLIGSYDFNVTVTTYYNMDSFVMVENEIVTINRNSATDTLSDNQVVARGLDGSSAEFILDITGDAFIIVEPSYASGGKGIINTDNNISLDIQFNIQNSKHVGVATKR